MHKRIELTVFFPSIFQHLSTNNSAQQVGDLAHPLSEKYSRNRIKKKTKRWAKNTALRNQKRMGKRNTANRAYCCTTWLACSLQYFSTCRNSVTIQFIDSNDPSCQGYPSQNQTPPFPVSSSSQNVQVCSSSFLRFAKLSCMGRRHVSVIPCTPLGGTWSIHTSWV